MLSSVIAPFEPWRIRDTRLSPSRFQEHAPE
jgi:hypothetical protein